MQHDTDRELKARLVRDCNSIDLTAKQSSPSSSSHEVESTENQPYIAQAG